MKPSDRESFTLLMGELCVAFRVEPTVELFNAYWKHVADMDIETFKQAVEFIIKTDSVFPPISKFVHYTPANQYGLRVMW